MMELPLSDLAITVLFMLSFSRICRIVLLSDFAMWEECLLLWVYSVLKFLTAYPSEELLCSTESTAIFGTVYNRLHTKHY